MKNNLEHIENSLENILQILENKKKIDLDKSIIDEKYLSKAKQNILELLNKNKFLEADIKETNENSDKLFEINEEKDKKDKKIQELYKVIGNLKNKLLLNGNLTYKLEKQEKMNQFLIEEIELINKNNFGKKWKYINYDINYSWFKNKFRSDIWIDEAKVILALIWNHYTKDDIKKNYLFLAQRYHPDKFIDKKEINEATFKIQQLNFARELLDLEIKR